MIRRTLPLAVLTLSLLAACGGNGAASGNTLTIYVDGDVNVRDLYQKTLIPGFEKANAGIKVNMVFSEHGQNNTPMLNRLGASVKTDAEPPFDIVDSGITKNAAHGKLLDPLGADKVPNLSKVSDQLLVPVDHRAMPYRGSAVILAYDGTKVTSPPKTMADLLAWIKANPGRFTYNSPNTGGSGDAFLNTVLTMHMDAASVQKSTQTYDTGIQTQWQAGLEVLKGLTPAVYQKVYPNGNQEVINLLAKGEISMAPVWSDQILAAKDNGLIKDNIKLAQITDPPFTGSVTYIGMATNSKHKDAAYKWFNYVLEKEPQADIVRKMAGYPAIPSSELPAELQEKFKGLQTDNLRPGFETQTDSDAKQAWQKTVP
ncbi:PotD/PotF family extracellular solute-binding protein [Nonomuraea sp. NPDC050536]|uniref:PotD/PotF family extracellular solute-binding protein n=1 Tax=Nonomuraea sp. NPDC050536 TaxID=3364366 RepID=UPI0037C53368